MRGGLGWVGLGSRELQLRLRLYICSADMDTGWCFLLSCVGNALLLWRHD